jgi:hypothetical protein
MILCSKGGNRCLNNSVKDRFHLQFTIRLERQGLMSPPQLKMATRSKQQHNKSTGIVKQPARAVIAKKVVVI